MTINFSFSSINNANYATAQSDGVKFLVGTRTYYQGNTGLFNTRAVPGLIYDPSKYEVEHGFWAWFIYPTAMCESKGSFFCLNTYDRAQFTFSFMQYAAHVPNGDFVKFFKKLLALPNAADYFPKLVLQNGRIYYKAQSTGTLQQLEDDRTTQALMDYLNPGLSEVEQQELICCARFVHWAMNDPMHVKTQVDVAVEHFRSNMKDYARDYNLDNVPDKVCLAICDIRHQGRARSSDILNAMNTGGNYEKAYNNLVNLGITHYTDRIKTLKSSVSNLVAQGKLGTKVYNAGSGEFV